MVAGQRGSESRAYEAGGEREGKGLLGFLRLFPELFEKSAKKKRERKEVFFSSSFVTPLFTCFPTQVQREPSQHSNQKAAAATTAVSQNDGDRKKSCKRFEFKNFDS